ncbi:helix-turn-helix domain-containing protein [Bifidobacterium amazonense]|uniref:Helix-turn-helix domain-containing protein n=1 Tax=Bifidobacterium amazonense TaxID=2809027 RepID=A0ABS9VS25_9BIFI|nr:helix-turn-helix domain-containing protein [Bifidobacterium amazonense]MCH9274884.1 helix-turn-helix domain-containing protein [Bifidobacterium amazonense]
MDNGSTRRTTGSTVRPLVDLSDLPRLLTKPEVGDLLRISPSGVDRLLSSGRLPCYHLGRRVLVPRDALETLLARPFNAAVLR